MFKCVTLHLYGVTGTLIVLFIPLPGGQHFKCKHRHVCLQVKKFNLYSGGEHPYMKRSHPHHRQTMSDPGARAAFSLRSIHTNAAVLGLDDLYYCDKYAMKHPIFTTCLS